MKNFIKKSLSLLFIGALFASITLTGCKSNKAAEENTAENTIENTVENTVETAEENAKESITLGEGNTEFELIVADADGNETYYHIKTDADNVGDALLSVDLVKGDESEYGLYIKEVNGIVADYDVDKTYWAFYIDGEYAMTGVSSTPVTEGTTYSLKIEK